MYRTVLPLYLPTNVVFLDDDAGFLKHFSLLFDARLPCRPCRSAARALVEINGQMPVTSRLRGLANIALLDDVDERIVLDMTKLHHLIYDPDRFEHISVAIIDYDMPEMNGLEVCKRIQHPEVKKILLTGKADEKIAVEAFNAGLINQFVRKNVADVDRHLNQAIAKLQQEYFFDITKPIQLGLMENMARLLADARFNEAFNRIVSDNKFIEYYFSDHPKGFLLVDAKAGTGFILVMPAEVLESQREIARLNDAPRALLQLMDEGAHVPWFPTGDGYYNRSCALDWRQYLHPAHIVTERDEFRCAFIKPAPIAALEPDRIRSFQTYLELFDARHAAE
jgi:CheY-like chemotaxis protein